MTFTIENCWPGDCSLILAKQDYQDFPKVRGIETWQQSIEQNIEYFQGTKVDEKQHDHSSLATSSNGLLPLHLSHFSSTGTEQRSAAALLQWGKSLAAVIARQKWQRTALPLIPGLSLVQFRLVLEGLWFGSYQFGKLKQKKNEETPLLVIIADSKLQELQAILQDMAKQITAMQQVLNLVLSPANICTPEFFSDFATQQARILTGVQAETWGEERLKQEGMNLILAVGRGSPHESRLLILDYQGDSTNNEHIALVGKGVCFDTGGTNLKASAHIKGMQYDMMGGAIVYGSFYYLASSGIKGNIRAYIPLVENQIGCQAIKTGDIIKSAMGPTVEINNTDAEGRLILADAIHCAVQHKPSLLLDCATLTGAAIVALGEQCAAYYSSDDQVSELFAQSSRETGEDIWRLPLFHPYASFMESKLADISNISTKSSMGGSLTAALFLEKFALQKDGPRHPWLHLDLAGWSSLEEHPSLGKNAQTMGVRLLSCFVRKYLATGIKGYCP